MFGSIAPRVAARYTRLRRWSSLAPQETNETKEHAPFRSTAATTCTRAARVGTTTLARLFATRLEGATRKAAEKTETQDMACDLVIGGADVRVQYTAREGVARVREGTMEERAE